MMCSWFSMIEIKEAWLKFNLYFSLELCGILTISTLKGAA